MSNNHITPIKPWRWINLINGMFLLLLTETSLFGQCGSAVIQSVTGTATRSKVGQICLSGDSCPASPPQYYLTDTTVRNWGNTALGDCCCTNTTITYSYNSTQVFRYTPANSDPLNDGCPSASSISTAFNGNYTKSAVGDCSSSIETLLYTYNTNSGTWIDQNGNDVCDAWDSSEGNCNSWDGGIGSLYGWEKANISCSQSITNLNNFESGTGSITETLSIPYTTTILESTVGGYATARMAQMGTNFLNSDAVSANTLDSEEFCATATRSKWRIVITGTTPNQSYDITYVVVTQHATGATTRSTVKITKKAPNQDPWYVNSANGDDVPISAWPTGCPQSGGTESVTYTSASITLSPFN